MKHSRHQCTCTHPVVRHLALIVVFEVQRVYVERLGDQGAVSNPEITLSMLTVWCKECIRVLHIVTNNTSGSRGRPPQRPRTYNFYV